MRLVGEWDCVGIDQLSILGFWVLKVATAGQHELAFSRDPESLPIIVRLAQFTPSSVASVVRREADQPLIAKSLISHCHHSIVYVLARKRL